MDEASVTDVVRRVEVESSVKSGRLLAALSGEWLPPSLYKTALRPFAPVADGTALFLLSAYASFHASVIASSAFRPWLPGKPISWEATAFWLLLVAWAIGHYLRQTAEDIRRRKSERQLRAENEGLLASMQAAFRLSPNPDLMKKYPAIYTACLDAHSRGRATCEQANPDVQAIAAEVKKTLEKITELAKLISRPSSEARYGANVMIAHDPLPTQAGAMVFSEAIVRRMRFFDHQKHSVSKLKCILELRKELTHVEGNGQPRLLPDITLPVPSNALRDNGKTDALPGAPYTLHTGELVAFTNTRELTDWCRSNGNFDPTVLEEISNYFSPTGDGAEIGSFASIRLDLPGSRGYVGVLNIDSDKPGVLGYAELYAKAAAQSPERLIERQVLEGYSDTFYALLIPILPLLADLVYCFRNQMLVAPQAGASPAPNQAPTAP